MELKDVDLARQVNELREALTKSQRESAKHKERTELLVDAVYRGVIDATLMQGGVPAATGPEKDARRKGLEVALWHITDTQGTKITESYNSAVMRDRIMLFAKKAAKITEMQRSAHPVKDCHILFGGDMIEGLFNFPTQPFEVEAHLFEQIVIVSDLMVELVQYALTVYEKVYVTSEWGNHGRIGSKRDAVVRSDNMDRMAYYCAILKLQDDIKSGRLIWEDSSEDIQRVEIGNYRALLIHGDEVGRNGFASPMTIVRHADRWRSGAYPWEFQDVYVGHYHTHNEWAMANGRGAVYQTGSTESDNRYARETMAASAIPTQRLHFIDPEKGRVTSQYKVWLDE